jgi:hypothetical protein
MRGCRVGKQGTGTGASDSVPTRLVNVSLVETCSHTPGAVSLLKYPSSVTSEFCLCTI